MKTNSVAIKGKDSCCGCGNCAISCPKNAVRMDLDGEGFEYPTVDEDLCVNCGKCIKVCPFELAKDEPCSNVISCYSGFYNTDKEHLSTSSGGVATAISKSFIKYQQISYTFYFINAILNPSQMYCSHSMTASFILSVFIHSKKSGISPHFSTIITTYLRRRTHDLTHKSIF